MIVKIKAGDNGKFKCVAENNYLSKSQRNSVVTVNVVPVDIENQQTGLLPPLQSSKQLVAEGDNITLYCVGFSEKVGYLLVYTFVASKHTHIKPPRVKKTSIFFYISFLNSIILFN